MKKILILLLTICVTVLQHFSCSTSIAGGSSSTDNGKVLGSMVLEGGQPATHTQVMLIPGDYNPYVNTTNLYHTVTDDEGSYTFSHISVGTYNVLAVHSTLRTRAIISGVLVDDDTTVVQPDTLKQPGTLKIFLPDYSNPIHGYVYLQGTTVYRELNDSSTFVILDSVPYGVINSVNYATKDSSTQAVIRYGVSVPSSDTFFVTLPKWRYSRQLVLNTSATGAQVSSDIINVPVLVRLTENTFDFSQAQNDGSDIRFTKNDNSLLPYEIESWDAASKVAAIWIKADTVYGNNSTQKIQMTWGNSGAAGLSNSTAVFDTANAYRGVWHLNRGCQDATINKYTGTNYGTADTTGLIGHSKKFDGTDSIRVPGLAGTPPSITLSAWASLAMADDSGSEVVSVGNAVLLRMDDTRFNNTWGTMASYHTDNTHYDFGSGLFHAKTGWHHIAFTIDNVNAKQYFYVDGVLCDSGSLTTPIDYTGVGQNILFGSRGENSQIYSYTGLIDEVRISRVARSPDYIKLCFMNQKKDDVLVVFE